MAMNERDRIDIIATLHDRFKRPAEEIISKMEEMEDQADRTGDQIDDLEDSLDRESKTTRKNTKYLDENSKARGRSTDALDDQADALDRGNRNLRNNNKALRDGLRPNRAYADAQSRSASAASRLADATMASAEAHRDDDEAVQRASRTIQDHTQKTERARDALGRFTRSTDTATESVKQNTKHTDENTKSSKEHTRQTDRDRDSWTRWNNRIGKITSGIGKRFRPIGAFYANYFKILGAFRGLLFSDIGALIPQLITAVVTLGAAFNATLAPMGRFIGALGQIAPLMVSFGLAYVVAKVGVTALTDAMGKLTASTYNPTMDAQYMEEYGENTWGLAKALFEVKEAYAQLAKPLREKLFDDLADPVKELAMTTLPLLEKHLGTTADLMNGALKEGVEGLTSPGSQKTIDSVLGQSATNAGLLVDVMFSLIDVFLEIADAAGPSLTDTLTALDDKLDELTEWMRDHKDEMTDFFNRAGDTAGNVFKGIGFILVGLKGISDAAKPLEDFLYGGLLDKLEGWSEKMNDPKQQEAMAKNYEAMIPNLEAIGNLVGAIIDGAKEIATSEYFAPLVNDLADNGIPTIVDYFKELDKTVGPPLLRITDALSDVDSSDLTNMLAPLGDLLGALAGALELVVPLFNGLPQPMQDVVTYGMGLVAMGLPGFFMLLLSPLKLVGKAWDALVWVGRKFAGLIVDIAESPFGKKIGEWAGKLGKFFKPIGEFLGKWLGKIGGGGLIARLFGKLAGKGILAVLGPIGAVIGVLWLLWDVISWLWNNVKPFRDFFIGLWDWIVDAWNTSIDWIVNTAVPWVVGAFQAIWDGIKQVGEWIADFYNTWIKPVIDAIVWFAKLVFVAIATFIITPFYLLWQALSPIVGDVVDWFKATIPVALDFLKQKWEQVTNALGAAWEGVKLVFGIVVGAIVGAATWLWTQITNVLTWIKNAWNTSWTFMKDLVTLVWAWIMYKVVMPVVVWFQTYVWPVIAAVIGWIVGKFNWFRDRVSDAWNWIKAHVIAPVVDWFQNNISPRISNVINNLKNKFYWLRDRVSDAWNAIKSVMKSVYDNKIKPIFDKFTDVINALKHSFEVARDAIGAAWQDVKNKLMGPTEWVVDVVYNNGIRKVWNELAKKVDLGTELPIVSFGGAGSGGIGGGRGAARGTAKVAAFYTGGHAEGYTGPGSKYQEAGVVHADEFVVRKTARRSIESAAPGLLDNMNHYGARALTSTGHMGGFAEGGRVPGYDGGGKVLHTWQEISAIPHAGMTVTSTYRKGAKTAGTGSTSLHALGRAVDFAGTAADMRAFFNYVRDNYKVSELIHTPMGGRQLSRGGKPRANFPAATARGHYNHVHVGGYGQGEAVGSGNVLGDWLMPNPFDGLFDKVMKTVPGAGPLKDLVTAYARKPIDAATKKAQDAINTAANTGYDMATGGLSAAIGGTNSSIRWRSTAINALKHTGDYNQANLDALLRRLYKESKGDPNAVNNWDSNAAKGTPSKGLMQVIQPTFNAYRDKTLSSNIFDPMANMVASIRYAKSRYSSLASAYNRAGGYYAGGRVKPINHMRFMGGPVETWGNTLVGEFGPELFMPSDGGPGSLLGLHGPELLSFNREGAIAPHKAVAALGAYNEHMSTDNRSEHSETSHYDVTVTVGGGATDQDIEGAVERAIAKAERKKRERR